MDIRILGSGCSRCGEVVQRTINVLADMNSPANVEKVTDVKQIMSLGILATPALVINGKIKCAGRIPRPEEIKSWILEAQA
ncbi:MAG TPA: thioredoxin family protein [Candidatus Latescibacteria bacterium]|nr:thioredoxin family protein [Candidatus Latescibacterota bacterium]